MRETLTYILAVIGAGSLICTVIVICMFVVDEIKWAIQQAKRRRQYKHRFDKKPTAKCYCIDCIYYCESDSRCAKFDKWYVADNWFCWNAEPRKEKRV